MSTLLTKIQKELPEFADSCNSMSGDDVKNALVELAKHFQEIVDAKEKDEYLQELKDKLKDANGPYRDTAKMIRLKTQYLLSLLQERGVA